MEIQDLKINSIIDNHTLCKIFKCAPQGGMRRSHRTNTLVLISDRTKLYEDKSENGIYHYTGMGQVGNQELKSQNMTLAESRKNDISVHFFEVMKPKQYTYRGEVELVAAPYIDQQKDINGLMRNVWVFPLKKISDADNSWVQEIEEFEAELNRDTIITHTEIEQIVKARIGQSNFKKKLINRECKCALCGVTGIGLLIASHIKPWSKSTNEERLDVDNGLLLCPNHDSLFDKGLISFDANGRLKISSQLEENSIIFMNVNPSMKITMNDNMKLYMSEHLNYIFIN